MQTLVERAKTRAAMQMAWTWSDVVPEPSDHSDLQWALAGCQPITLRQIEGAALLERSEVK